MRIVWIILCGAALAGCAATSQEVVARLGQQYVGQNISVLVSQYGPPANSFRLPNGDNSYQWQLSNFSQGAYDRGVFAGNTLYCKVSVISTPTGQITQLNTEDADLRAGVFGLVNYGSICARRLGMGRQS